MHKTLGIVYDGGIGKYAHADVFDWDGDGYIDSIRQPKRNKRRELMDFQVDSITGLDYIPNEAALRRIVTIDRARPWAPIGVLYIDTVVLLGKNHWYFA